MKAFTHARALGAAGIVALLFGGSCGGSAGGLDAAGTSDTIPAGWSGARALAMQRSDCPTGGVVQPPVHASESGGAVTGILECAWFRLGQAVCGYVVDAGATTRVLVQPCDLHPTVVPKGMQAFNVTFTLPARAGRTAVEVYRRFDFYGATTPPEPMLLATVPVGQADAGAQ